MNACPNCKSNNIINLDIAIPPVLFECSNCNARFHAAGISPSEIDAQQSLNIHERAQLNALLQRR